jgi:polysaccharide export outer membrane protein
MSLRWVPLSLALVMAPAPVLALPSSAARPAPERTAARANPAEDAYILGAGDGLQLRFLAAEELTGPLEILSDGTATLPLVGSVRLSGLTLPQANYWLEMLYRRQLLRPDLQLTVVRPRPLRIALVGEVERPGIYTLSTSETSNTEAKVTITGLPTLVDAIQKAGGVTPLANLQTVVLQRRLPGETPAFKRTRLNLLALVREGDQLQNPLLFDGDTVKLERAAEPVPEAIEVAATTLSPTTINVNVVGEVVRPGAVELPANTPLVQAVLAAGGPQSWRANRGNVELVRINRNGSATRERFVLNLAQGASNQKNPPLRDGDTVLVNRSGFAAMSDAITAVGQPLTSVANVFALIKLLNNTN